jgi:Neuraminidase (sialidase)
MHYAWISYKTATSAGQTTLQDMYAEAAYSDDGGATWSNGALVTTSGDNGSGTLLVDKPWLVAGPDGTLVYTFSVGDRAQQHLYASVSVDHGQSWGPKQLLYGPTEGSDNASGHNLAMPVFDPSDATGKTLYAVYVKYTATAAVTGNSVQLTKSTDRGLTWTALGPVSASTDQVLFDAPSVAMDGSKHLYVGYTASPQGGDAKYWDALVATIDVSASTPVVLHRTRASDDQASCFQHFHATVQADSASGKVFVAWLDNRNNGKGGVYYAVSTDQGASFSVNRRISDADFTFNPDRQNAQLDFLGDYFGLLFDGTRLRAAWSDPRNGNDAQVIFASGTP